MRWFSLGIRLFTHLAATDLAKVHVAKWIISTAANYFGASGAA